jgi:hypothetical protein
MSVSYDCCVLSGIGLCDGLITHPEEYYQMCVCLKCDREASIMRGPRPPRGSRARKRNSACKGQLSLGPVTRRVSLPIGSRLQFVVLWSCDQCQADGNSHWSRQDSLRTVSQQARCLHARSQIGSGI